MTPQYIYQYYLSSPYAGSFSESPEVLSVQLGSLSAGEVMQLQVKLDTKHRVTDARFKVYGCGYAIATCAYLCEQLIGQDLASVAMSTADLIAALKLPETKYHCALLAEDLLKTLQKNHTTGHQSMEHSIHHADF